MFILGSFCDHFGIISGSSFIILEYVLDNCGIVLKSFWDRFGIVLGSCWNHFGIILESFWDHFGIILGSFWDHFEKTEKEARTGNRGSASSSNRANPNGRSTLPRTSMRGD